MSEQKKSDAPLVTAAQVTIENILIPQWGGLHPKQVSETQNDSFGLMMKNIFLVFPDGSVKYIQKDGQPVTGILPNKDRQAVKLAGLVWFVEPGSIKGNGYVNAMAANLSQITALLGKLSAKHIGISYEYGEKSSKMFVADPNHLAAVVSSIVMIFTDTIKKYPPKADAAVKVVAGAPKTETVELVL